ncbi:MAG: DUF3696 domain-containing protein [Planctomycetes bacterium]|nr:DUF3696 domain-containing protein [Planctomycetota bacterium]
MLTGLDLSNFKAWERIREMRLARLTGLFGTNSSGKSSILQVLLMLKQTADSPDRQQVLYLGEEKSERSLAVFGTFDDLLFKGAKQRSLDLKLSWRTLEELVVADPEDDDAEPILSGSDIAIATSVGEDAQGRLVVDEMAYEFAGCRFAMRPRPSSDGRTQSKYDLSVESGPFSFKKSQGRPPEGLSPPVKFYGFPDQVRAAYQNAGFLSDLELEFERQMQRTYYLGPLREYPYRDYRWSGTEPMDMGRRGEKVVSALLSAAARGATVGKRRGKRQPLEAKVAWWLKELGLIHDFQVEPINKESNLYRVSVRRSKSSARVLLPDVGFGVSQVLPVIVLCFYVPEGSTILLEQPEIHLHPSVQQGLADVFIDAIQTRGVQIIVESHSEHLLRRLQRRVAEGKFNKDDAALYFCETPNGASTLTGLDLDLFGQVRNWPRDFFGNELEDIAKSIEAGRKRRQKSEA